MFKKSTVLLIFLVFILSSCVAPAAPTSTWTAKPTDLSYANQLPTPTRELIPSQTAALIPTAINTPVPPPTRPPTPTFTPMPGNGVRARRHLAALSAEIGQRMAGSPEEAKAAEYISTAFAEMGYAPITQFFSFEFEGVPIESANIIAVKPGSSTQEIIIGAHYDSMPVGRGADDNASGVAVMLEVAERVKDIQTPYTLRFIAFGSEELGLQGSTYYVSQMTTSEIENTLAMVNLDSLVAGEIAYVYGDEGEAGILRDWCLQWAADQGLMLQTQPGENPEYPAGTTCDCSDHAPFVDAGVRYAYFESTNWGLGDKDGYVQVDERYGEDGEIWHTEYDTLEYIDATFPNRIDERLGLFTALLYALVTEFEFP